MGNLVRRSRLKASKGPQKSSKKVTIDGVGCKLWSGVKDNIVAIGRAYSLNKVSYKMKSGMMAEVTSYNVRCCEVLNETIILPLGTSSWIKTLKDVGDAKIIWPANQTILDQKVSQPKHYDHVKSTALLNGSPSRIAISEKVPEVTQQNSGKHTLDLTPKATSNRSKYDITTTAAVHPGRRCYLFDALSKANVLAKRIAFFLPGLQQLHGSIGVEVDCHKILIEEVIKENYSLPVRFAGMETLGQTLGKAIPWPKYGFKITEPAKKKAKYDFWNGYRGNVVAIDSILPTVPNHKIHRQELPEHCYAANILEVIDPSFVLTEPSGEFKLLGEDKDSFVAWPKDKCSISDDKETPPHGKPHEKPEPVLDSEKKFDNGKLNEDHLAVNPHSGSYGASENLSQKTKNAQRRLYLPTVQKALQLSAAQQRKTRSDASRMSQTGLLHAETPPLKNLKKN